MRPGLKRACSSYSSSPPTPPSVCCWFLRKLAAKPGRSDRGRWLCCARASCCSAQFICPALLPGRRCSGTARLVSGERSPDTGRCSLRANCCHVGRVSDPQCVMTSRHICVFKTQAVSDGSGGRCDSAPPAAGQRHILQQTSQILVSTGIVQVRVGVCLSPLRARSMYLCIYIYLYMSV